MYKNKVNAESFGMGKEKGLIKIVKLTWEFEEMLEGRALFKVGPSVGLVDHKVRSDTETD